MIGSPTAFHIWFISSPILLVLAGSPFWISSETPKALKDGKPLKCMFKARYRQHLEECVVCFSNSTSREALSVGMGVAASKSSEFTPSTFCRLHKSQSQDSKQQLQVRTC
jgi:hypothetical protein